MKHLKKSIALVLILFCFLSCGVTKNREAKKVVSIAVSIDTREPQLNSVNFDVFAYKIIDRLEDFNVVDLDRVDETDTAEIVLNIKIDRFSSFPPEQRVTRRVFRRNVLVGKDSNGKAVYQAVSASADIIQLRTRTSAFFVSNLIIRGTPGKTFQRNFSSNLNIDNVYVDNIRGDTRALDPSIYTATMPPIEPLTDEILLALSDKEMLGRLSREIRSYYDK